MEADGVIVADPDEDEFLDVPEVAEDDGMPGSDIED
jgi:hypothetical protein